MSTNKKKSGGKRPGAGRPPKAPTVVFQLNIDKQLLIDLNKLYTAKERNDKMRAFMVSLCCV